MNSTNKRLISICTILFLVTLEGCLFGGSKKPERERSSLLGTVIHHSAKKEQTNAPPDSLEIGFVQYSFNGMRIGGALIEHGLFTLENLAPSCCYRVEILTAKQGDLLGVDSLVELETGLNKKLFYIATSVSDTTVILPDSSVKPRIILPPKRG